MAKLKRACGVLLPVASLPSRYGIGSFSREAYAFIDFLKKAKQTYWQILPLGQTGYGDSPYQSFSTFAGNPYFIDLEQLIEAGYISREEADACNFGNDPQTIWYKEISENRFKLLYQAYRNSPFAEVPAEKWAAADYDGDRAAFEEFSRENASWLDDYALYSAVKNSFHGAAFSQWDDDIRRRKPEVMKAYQEKLSENPFLQVPAVPVPETVAGAEELCERKRHPHYRRHPDLCGV